MKVKVFFILVFFLTVSITMVHAQVTIGSNTKPAGGALLDLKEFDNPDTTSATRGMLFSRVKLTKATELYPMYGTDAASETSEYTNNKADLKVKHTGLVVYNLSVDTIFSQGLYIWDGGSWIKPVTKVPTPPSAPNVNMLDLLNSVSPIANGDSQNNGATGGGGSTLDFGSVTIPENGSYIFNFRLYGQHNAGTGVYYLSLWANGTELKDITEIDVNVGTFKQGNPACTYSVTMGAYFSAKDNVTFKLAAHPRLSAGNNWNLTSHPGEPKNADRTSMVWWRL